MNEYPRGYPDKRSPTELRAALIGADSAVDAPAKRPLTTTLGAAFVFLRAAAGVLWLTGLALVWQQIAEEVDLTPDESRFALWLILGVGVGAIIVLITLGVMILYGSNVARVLVLLALTLSITSAAVGYFTLGEEITIRSTLLTLSFDILVLLALSSRETRAWARRPRTRTPAHSNHI